MNNSYTVGSSLTKMSAINEDALDKLVVEIYDYASKIKSILGNMEDLVLGTETYFDCEVGINARNKFKLLSSRFAVIPDNIVSYAEDLVQVKTSYYKISDDLTAMANNSKSNLQSKEISSYQERR